jgi:hypothetical protein
MDRVKVVWLVAVVCLVLLATSLAGWAATDQKTLTINATVNAKAKLTLGVATIHFANADPDDVPSVSATENPVTVSVKAHAASGSTVTLTVQANGDLVSGGDSIAISNVTWTVTGAGFVAGTMNTIAVPAGSWSGSGNRSGTFSYFLANSWNYASGSYAQTAVYTLTAL